MRYFERAVSFVPELGKKAMPPMTMPAMTIDKWTEAWKRFDRAYALWREGDAMLQQHRYTEAISVLLQAVNLAPRWAALHSTLGWLYTLARQLPEAKQSLGRAIDIDPHLAEAHNNYGMLHLIEGEHEAAEGCFRHALELKPDFPEATANLDGLDEMFSTLHGSPLAWSMLFWFAADEISDCGYAAYVRWN